MTPTLLLSASLALVVPVSPQGVPASRKLSGTMQGITHGDAYELEFTSDGRVVYSADAIDDGVVELFVAPADGSASPTRLGVVTTVSEPFPFQPSAFRVSPDGTRVVYRSDPDGNNRFEILSVPLDLSAPPVTLNATLITDRNVEPEFLISPDGQYVVYRADQDLYQQVELYAAPIDGSAPTVRVNGEMVVGGDVLRFAGGAFLGFQVTPDSQSVAYVADQDVDGQFNLYLAPIDGSAAPEVLNAIPGGVVASLLTPDGSHAVYLQIVGGVPTLLRAALDGSTSPLSLASDVVMPFALTADGQRVVYQTTSSALFSRPVDASAAAVRLDTPPVPGGAVVEFRIAPDGQRVVYLADAQVNERFDLFSVPSDGSAAAIKLDGTLVAGGDVFRDDIYGLAASLGITSDSSQVVFMADREVDERIDLYAVPLAGGAIVRLSPVLGADRDVAPGLRLSADGTRVLFRADVEQDDVFELYGATLDGTSTVKLNGPLPPGGNLADDEVGSGYFGFEIAPDGLSVAYIADQVQDGRHEVCSVPVTGGTPIVLNDPFAIHEIAGDVSHSWVEGRRLVYLADQETDGVSELYSVDLRGPALALKLNGPLVPGGNVRAPSLSAPESATVRLTPDGTRVIYLADQDTDEVFELYSVVSDGSAAPVKLHPALDGGRDVLAGFRLSPDGSRVVYSADQEVDERFDLYSVPSDGSGPPVRLNVAHAFTDVGSDFLVSNDGLGVVYRADQDSDEVFELYVVHIDRLFPPVRRSAAMIAAGDVASFAIASDDQHVVYSADAEQDGRVELYAFPVFGGAPAWKLNAPMVTGGSVAEFVIAPDGTRVAYGAIQSVPGVRELYSVPIDASSTPVTLSAPMVPGQDVFELSIDADSARVAYLADKAVAGKEELYSVPIDGSSAPIQLNPPIAGTSDVRDYVLAEGRVVFRVVDSTVQTDTLLSAPLDGSTAAVQLNGSLPGARVMGAPQIRAQGGLVYFVAQASSVSSWELYRVPLAGGSAPRRLSVSLVFGNSAWPLYQVVGHGDSVTFRSDLALPGTWELFQAWLGADALLDRGRR